MRIAEILRTMFDPEEKKKELDKKKKQAMDQVKVPPLMGYHSQEPEQISQSMIMNEDQVWLWYFKESETVRKKAGVETVDGKWVIKDREAFDRNVSEYRKELLRPIWRTGKK